MKITNKTLLTLILFALIYFFINEITYYNTELKNTKKELYKKNEATFHTIKSMQNSSIKSLSMMLANDDVIKEAFEYDDPNLIIEHLQEYWKKISKEKLIYEIHFFKPPAESFVNFSNFQSHGKDVSDVRTDIVHVTSTYESSLHAIMCKTYAGLRATTAIIGDDGKILGGLSMGKKIDWLPNTIKGILNYDSFLVYNTSSTKALEKPFYKSFMKGKTLINEYILADKTINITPEDINKIDFKKDIQDITINGKTYSLNIFRILDFEKKDLGYLAILNDLDEFNKNFRDRIIKNIFLLFIVSSFVYLLLRTKLSSIIRKIKELQTITRELKVNNFSILKDKNIKIDCIKDEFCELQADIIDMGNSLEKSYLHLEKEVQNRTKELEYEKNYIQKILNLIPEITLVTNGEKLISANQRFFDFVEYKTIEEFLKDHDCICDYFLSVDDKEFNRETKMIDGKIWSIYIAQNSDSLHTVILEKNDIRYYFNVNAVYLDEIEVLVTLQDITELKKKDSLLYEQSKMASMGEMIGNIAHQWRQPLSIISTSASGMKIQKEINCLSDDEFNKMCDMIDTNAQYLSKTIDDFRNFIKGDRQLAKFNLKKNIEDTLQIVGASIKVNHIDIVLDLDKNIIIEGYPNELAQCFINIINNAKDILENQEGIKVIFIETKNENGTITISFKDNAGGINEDIKSKIFDPYFTTKHQFQGTGLGLHMTYKLIVEGMDGMIEANNVTFNYKNNEYKGAEFKITLNNS